MPKVNDSTDALIREIRGDRLQRISFTALNYLSWVTAAVGGVLVGFGRLIGFVFIALTVILSVLLRRWSRLQRKQLRMKIDVVEFMLAYREHEERLSALTPESTEYVNERKRFENIVNTHGEGWQYLYSLEQQDRELP